MTPGTAYRYDTAIGGKGVRDVHAAPDGELWFAQNNGLGHFDGRRFHVYSIDHGITGDALNTITPDANGSLWIGTDTNGASTARSAAGSRRIRSRNGRARPGSGHLGRIGSGTLYAIDGHTGAINFFDDNQFVPVRPNVPCVGGPGEPWSPTHSHRGSSRRLVGAHGGRDYTGFPPWTMSGSSRRCAHVPYTRHATG